MVAQPQVLQHCTLQQTMIRPLLVRTTTLRNSHDAWHDLFCNTITAAFSCNVQHKPLIQWRLCWNKMAVSHSSLRDQTATAGLWRTTKPRQG